jgi:predicted RNA-binding protein with PIN domain
LILFAEQPKLLAIEVIRRIAGVPMKPKTAAARRVFVDALNVIRANPSLAKLEDERGTPAACRELLRLCRDYVTRAGAGAEFAIVFDGRDADGGDVGASAAFLTLYAGERTADAVIIEKADDARALGIDVWIVSNDAEVRAAAAHAIRSEEFYEDLTRRPPAREPRAERGPAERAQRLVAHLAEAGHLPPRAAADAALVADLAAHLDYYSLGEPHVQKLAKKLEAVFRERARVTPDPDPQKAFQRELKKFLGAEKI